MGIEHPILGLMTFTIIITALVGAIVFLAVYNYNLQQNILTMPLTTGYAQCYTTILSNGVYTNTTGIFVANTHRVALDLIKIWVGTETGIVEVPVSSIGFTLTRLDNAIILVWTAGFHEGNRLLQGQPGTVWVQIKSSSPLHLKGKVYSITLYFKVEGQDAFITQEARVKPGETPICPKIPSPPISLILSHRGAVYYDTFDTDPFANRRLKEQTCDWTYEATLKAVSIRAASRGPGGWGYWCVAYIQTIDITSYVEAGETVYVAFLVFRSDFTAFFIFPTIRVAALYLDPGASQFYGIGYEDIVLIGRSGDIVSSIIFLVSAGGTYNPLSTLPRGRSLTLEDWYLSHVSTSINFSSWIAIHWNQTFEHPKALPWGLFNPKAAGIGYYTSTTRVNGIVYFDNLVVSVGRPPWIVEVGGLPSGWKVVLKNATGYPVTEAVAGPDGVARLIVAPPIVDLYVEPNNRNGFIFPNGIIEVYDELGILVFSQQFSAIIGGDRFEIVRG